MRRLPATAALVAFALGASACGQRGPLYFRENPPAGVKVPRDPYKPVPYPKSVTSDAEREGAPEDK